MKRIILVALFTVVFGAIALAQQTHTTNTGDGENEKGANVPTFFTTGPACLVAQQYNIYEPRDITRLSAWQEQYEHKEAGLTSYPFVICAREQTAMGERIIRVPANTPLFTKNGRAVADGRCGNEISEIFLPPQPEPPAPLPNPSCTLTGDKEKGYESAVANADAGKWYLDGNFVVDWNSGTGKLTPILEKIPPGDHTFRLDVMGPGGNASCSATFSIEPPSLPPLSPAIVEKLHTCPTCEISIKLYPRSKTIKLSSKVTDGYASGEWSIGPHVIGKGSTLMVSHDRLLKLAGKGEHRITFKTSDSEGHEVICVGTVKLEKKGRFWLFKLPGLNCLYAWTIDIRNWSLSGAIEKGACLAAGYGAYYWMGRGGAAAVIPRKIWIPGRP